MSVGSPSSTGCAALNTLLGSGLPTGTVTQVYGPPGTGKTNIAVQAAVAALRRGETVTYIDTEGIPSNRFHELLEASGTRDGDTVTVRPENRNGSGEQSEALTTDGGVSYTESVTDRLRVLPVSSFTEQHHAVTETAAAIQNGVKTSDIVIMDSLTELYRGAVQGTDDGSSTRRLGKQVNALLQAARAQSLPVLTTNQVYTALPTSPGKDRTQDTGNRLETTAFPVPTPRTERNSKQNDDGVIQPLGGHTVAHCTDVIVELNTDAEPESSSNSETNPVTGTVRDACLRKHPSKPTGETTTFAITDTGLTTP